MKTLLIYFLTVLIWGTTWLAIKFQLGEAPPEVSIFYRFVIASSLLLVYCKIKNYNLKFKFKDHFFLFLLGLSMFSIHYIFVYKATFFLVSGLVAVIFSLVSFFNILNSYLFFKKKPDNRILLGALCGLVGIIFFFWKDVAQLSLQSETLTGAGLILVAAFLFSLGNIVSRRNQNHGYELVTSTSLAMGYGALIMLAYISYQNLSFVLPQQVSYWVAMLYLSIPGSIVAFLCYLSLIRTIGPERAGYATVLFPVVAVMISLYLENYRLSSFDIAGIGLITLGNCLIILKKRIELRQSSV